VHRFLTANSCLDFAVRENVTPRDRDILRELAKRYVEVCADPEQSIRRALWRRHNSLKRTKIDILRQIPNLRRIAVAPAANAARCAEQIGPDYVLSYRPSPTEMVVIRKDLAACRGCHVDITLKDVETVQGDPDRVREWVRVVREEAERG
jgi:hypothetical protein